MDNLKPTRKETGRIGEHRAALFLSLLGYTIYTRNWRCRIGEIDIVARDSTTWVFVEVRTRTSHTFGDAVESITYAKLQRMHRLAHLFLSQHDRNSPDLRIDFIGINLHLSATHIHHMKNIA